MMSLFSRFFAQNECPVLIWISARISEIEETSLATYGSQFMYVVRTTGRTGVELVPRTGHLSSVILSLHFVQTILAYTPDLGTLAR